MVGGIAQWMFWGQNFFSENFVPANHKNVAETTFVHPAQNNLSDVLQTSF